MHRVISIIVLFTIAFAPTSALRNNRLRRSGSVPAPAPESVAPRQPQMPGQVNTVREQQPQSVVTTIEQIRAGSTRAGVDDADLPRPVQFLSEWPQRQDAELNAKQSVLDQRHRDLEELRDSEKQSIGTLKNTMAQTNAKAQQASKDIRRAAEAVNKRNKEELEKQVQNFQYRQAMLEENKKVIHEAAEAEVRAARASKLTEKLDVQAAVVDQGIQKLHEALQQAEDDFADMKRAVLGLAMKANAAKAAEKEALDTAKNEIGDNTKAKMTELITEVKTCEKERLEKFQGKVSNLAMANAKRLKMFSETMEQNQTLLKSEIDKAREKLNTTQGQGNAEQQQKMAELNQLLDDQALKQVASIDEQASVARARMSESTFGMNEEQRNQFNEIADGVQYAVPGAQQLMDGLAEFDEQFTTKSQNLQKVEEEEAAKADFVAAKKEVAKDVKALLKMKEGDSEGLKEVKEKGLVNVPGFNDIDENDLDFETQKLLENKDGAEKSWTDDLKINGDEVEVNRRKQEMLDSADVDGMESQNEASHNEYKEKQLQLAKDAAEMSRKGAELELLGASSDIAGGASANLIMDGWNLPSATLTVGGVQYDSRADWYEKKSSELPTHDTLVQGTLVNTKPKDELVLVMKLIPGMVELEGALDKSMDEVESEHQKLQESAQQVRDGLDAKIKELDEKMRTMETEFAELRAKATAAKLNVTSEAAQKVEEDLQESLEAKYEELQTNLTLKQAEMAKKQEEAGKRIAAAKKQLEKLQNTLDENSARVKKIRTEADAVRKAHRKEMSNILKEIFDIQQDVRNTKDATEHYRNAIKDVEPLLKTCKAQRKADPALLRQLKTQFAEMDAKYTEEREKLSKTRLMIQELSSGIDDAGNKDMCRPTGKPCLTLVENDDTFEDEWVQDYDQTITEGDGKYRADIPGSTPGKNYTAPCPSGCACTLVDENDENEKYCQSRLGPQN